MSTQQAQIERVSFLILLHLTVFFLGWLLYMGATANIIVLGILGLLLLVSHRYGCLILWFGYQEIINRNLNGAAT